MITLIYDLSFLIEIHQSMFKNYFFSKNKTKYPSLKKEGINPS